jgi:branched-chain amino acid transport system substrate-binding protein
MRSRQPYLLLFLSLLLIFTMGLVAACGGETEETTTTEPPATEETQPETTDTTEPETAGPPTGEPVRIGAIVSATGAASPLGEPERAALLMLQEKYNDAGGVLGRPIEIIIEDDQSNPQNAVTAANKLIQQDNVVALIAATISPSTLAVKPIAAQAGIPQMAMAAANAITDEPPADWIWRTPPKDALAAEKALEYISEQLNVTTLAVLHDENAFGTSGAEEIQASAPEFGLEVVTVQSYRTEDTDLTAQLTAIRGNNPEVLVVWGTNPGPAVAARNVQQLGLEIPYVGSHGIANRAFIELAGEAAEGVVFPAGKLLVPESITDPDQSAVVSEFISDFEAEVGNPPPTFAGHAHDALGILLDAIERAGDTDPEAIRDALNQTQNWPGADGIRNYSDDNRDGLTTDDLIVVRIEDGAWVLAEE